jgi:DNA-binding transcriptional regulator YiaG
MKMQNDRANKRTKRSGRDRRSASKRETVCENSGMGRSDIKNSFRHAGEKDRKPYHYTECGLDDVYLISGYEVENTAYGDGVSIKHLDELHKAIGYSLVTEKKVLSGKELRFLRKEMDLTQTELGQLVGLSDQQVARWEKDRYEIPSAADYLLRFFYLEHIKKTLDLRELIRALTEMDSQTSDDRFVFKPTRDGWKQAAA